MKIPELPTLPWESGRPQPVKAWICVVNPNSQGVKEHRNVVSIRSDQDGLLTVDHDKAVNIYNLEDVWGAWLQWPYRTFRSSSGETRIGPKYFLEFSFKEFEWLEHGVLKKTYTPSPKTYSIWCDDSNTDGDPMTTSRLRWDDYNSDCNGWVRANRVRWQKRIQSKHYPNMP